MRILAIREDEEIRPIARRVVGYALVLNAVWEFVHAGILYDMWTEVSLWKGLFHITLAILGDALIVLFVAGVAALCVGRGQVWEPPSYWNGLRVSWAGGPTTN